VTELLDDDAGEVGGAEPLAGVEDLEADDVPVLVLIHGDAVLDVDVVVSAGFPSSREPNRFQRGNISAIRDRAKRRQAEAGKRGSQAVT